MLLTQADRNRYSDFVASGEHASFLQMWEWGELKTRTGWEPLRLAVERGGKFVAAVQVLKRSVPGLGKSLLYGPGGPLLPAGADRDVFTELVVELDALAATHGAMALKVDPAVLADNEEYTCMLSDAGFRPAEIAEEGFGGTQPRYVMQVDISPTEEQLLAGFKPKWRYNIGLAERKGVRVGTAESPEDVVAFYHILTETAERDGFKVRALSYFRDIYELFIAPGRGALFLARFEDELVAGAITLACGHRAWYVYGASSNAHRNKMPNHLMQWEMMRWAKARGCTIYDMRGVARADDTDNPLQGLNRFKEGFGAQYVEYIGEWDRIYSPGWYRLLGVAEPVARRLRLFIAGIKRRAGG